MMPSAVSLYVIQARQSSRAVIFRRGPSKQVLLVSWDTESDTFEEGQWLKGRIYERRCDLSPDGKWLVYFAGHRPPLFSWTAISKPPFLTALALWPKGDCWGGGGLFQSPSRLALNHYAHQMQLGDGFAVPKRLTVEPFGAYSGAGEDEPIWSTRLQRDGWVVASGGKPSWNGRGASIRITLNPPALWEKRHPIDSDHCTLQMILNGIHERDGRYYVMDHRVVTSSGEAFTLERTSWADWSPSGDLLFAKGGALYRLPYTKRGLAPIENARELIDLTDRKFVPREAPVEATRWR
jgi:hypothetical protein